MTQMILVSHYFSKELTKNFSLLVHCYWYLLLFFTILSLFISALHTATLHGKALYSFSYLAPHKSSHCQTALSRFHFSHKWYISKYTFQYFYLTGLITSGILLTPTLSSSKDRLQMLFWGHVLRRFIEEHYIFPHPFNLLFFFKKNNLTSDKRLLSMSQMHIFAFGVGVTFYIFFPLTLHLHYKSQNGINPHVHCAWIFLFTLLSVAQSWCHCILASYKRQRLKRLRTRGSQDPLVYYREPTEGLFRFFFAPHYLLECGIYLWFFTVATLVFKSSYVNSLFWPTSFVIITQGINYYHTSQAYLLQRRLQAHENNQRIGVRITAC